MNQGFNPYIQSPEPSPNTYNQQQKFNQTYQNNIPVKDDIRRSFLAENDYAAETNQLISKKHSWHVRSLISTFFLVGGIATFVALSLTYVIQVSIGELVGICVGFYLFYLILSLCKNTMLSYLGNIQHGTNFQSSYNKTRSINGHFTFNVQCYHYETRYHTRTVTDSNGNKHTEHYTTQQKVVTHRATQQLYPKQCVDESGNVGQILAATQIIFVHNKVNYRFRDDGSRKVFQYAWASFQNRHRRDVHQDYRQNFELPGLVARLCFYIGQRPKNYKCIFIFCSIFGLIWPYSMYVESKVSRFDIQYMKVVGL